MTWPDCWLTPTFAQPVKELGAVKLGGQYRLRPDLLDGLRGPERINAGPTTDQQHGQPSTPTRQPDRDPRVNTTTLEAGWWKDDGQ